jgi:hypothetical protein
MSEYGKLWQKVSDIRENLREISRARTSFGQVRATSLIEVDKQLADAKRCVAILKSDLDSLISKWERLEEEMQECDSHTGNR